MGVFDFGSEHHERNRDAYNQIYEGGEEHQGKLSHEVVSERLERCWEIFNVDASDLMEVIVGGAAFFAMHEYEKKQREEGHQVNHAFAKELLAGIAAGEVDKLAETKGLDFLDREKAKHHARQQAEQMYDAQYGHLPEGGSYN